MDEQLPKLWVIVPHWNYEPREALLSVQACAEEVSGVFGGVVVVDDGSDDTADYHFARGFCEAASPYAGGVWDVVRSNRNCGGLASLIAGMQAIKAYGAEQRDIVCQVDGDDKLLPGALGAVYDVYSHDENCAMTYGSYRRKSDGKDVIAERYPRSQEVGWSDFRRLSWRASHLKTWRLGLFERIPPAWLLDPKNNTAPYPVYRFGVDRVTMLAMLELSGGAYGVIQKAIYEYNDLNPLNAFREFADEEADCVDRIHRERPLRALKERPW